MLSKLRLYHSISIHAPRGRGDSEPFQVLHKIFLFQSTPLAGGATWDVHNHFRLR